MPFKSEGEKAESSQRRPSPAGKTKKIDLTLLKVLHWPKLSVKGGGGGRDTCQVESTAGIVDPPVVGGAKNQQRS